MKVAICELCNNPSARSSIIGDIYYRHLCLACYNHLTQYESPSSGQADYDRGRETEENEAAIIQPFGRDGKPSSEFIHLYPEQAKTMFNDEEIDQATRT